METNHTDNIIQSYLHSKDDTLYAIMGDLGLLKILNCSDDKKGVTFLLPSEDLLKDLKKFDDDKKTDVLKSLIILDCYKNLDQLLTLNDNNKYYDVEMLNGNKLQIDKRLNDTVIIESDNKEGKAKIKVNDEFMELIKNDNNCNFMIFNLEGGFPKSDMLVDKSNIKPKKSIKGGADLRNINRQKLFENVLRACCENKQSNMDPAMELLCTLLDVMSKLNNNDVQALNLIKSQLSYDTLTSLAIILRPYSVNNKEMYISDNVLKELESLTNLTHINLYYFKKDLRTVYENHMNEFSKHVENYNNNIRNKQKILYTNVVKVNIVKDLINFYNNLKTDSSLVNDDFLNKRLMNTNIMIAEGELRIFSALLNEQNHYNKDIMELTHLYKNKCRLDNPYICDNQSLITPSNIAFYYSTVYLLTRSDALFYLPGLANNNYSVNPNDIASDSLIRIDFNKCNVDNSVYSNIFNT